MRNSNTQELTGRIADLKKRWPAHSVPIAMMQELDDLEEELDKGMKLVQQEEKNAQKNSDC